ncbi:MAG TPA: hypothetical protein VMT18_05455 [Planctomycetota bacterium]|nr:hypothetical protein [Planctomycetota bacterium]
MKYLLNPLIPILLAALLARTLPAQGTTLASADSNGKAFVHNLYLQGGLLIQPAPSDDGRYVLFTTLAADVVPGNAGGSWDVFRRDLWTGATELVSRPLVGDQANGDSWEGYLSADGRFVVFGSTATDLVAPGDTNGATDVFVRDMNAGTTLAVTELSPGVWPDGASWPEAFSADGRYVVFGSYAKNLVALPPGVAGVLYVKDLVGGSIEPVSVTPQGLPAFGSHFLSSISGDGRYVSFSSNSPQIVAGDTNGANDAFVRDRQSGTTTRVSVATGGVQAPQGGGRSTIARDGSCVVFESYSKGLVPNDPNSTNDVFVHDLASGVTECLSLSFLDGLPAGQCSVPRVSGDGRFVLFSCQSNAILPGLSGIAVVRLDRQQGTFEHVSQGTFGTWAHPASPGGISDDGRHCTFYSATQALVPEDVDPDQDLYVRDMASAPASTYCIAKTNSLGCVTWMSSTGVPSASSPAPFLLRASQVINQAPAVMIYALGAQLLPFQDGFLCLGPQVTRTFPQNSGGNPAGIDCSGVLELDMNAYLQASNDPDLVAGAQVYAQYWSRDPQAASTSNLSNAVMFLIGP